MFEKTIHYCPNCNWEFQDALEDGREVICPGCACEFLVRLDAAGDRAVFIQRRDRRIPEPLYLPRGSIRAMVSLSLAGTCWLLVGMGRDMPVSLAALLLTVLGYYFGFRKNSRAAQTAVHETGEKIDNPLFLPAGAIRILLMVGFGISALVLWSRGKLTQPPALDFYLILAGLLVGHIYSRITAGGRGSDLLVLINHLKGAVVLLAAAALVVLYLGEWQEEFHPSALALLSAVVSFYFGSR